MTKKWYFILLVLAIIGVIDAGYLTYEHFSGTVPPCTTGIIFADCGKVLQSSYSEVYGIPLALLGFIHYTIESIVIAFAIFTTHKLARRLTILLSTAGFLFSLYFVFLMIFVIEAICLYCLVSAIVSILLFIFLNIAFPNERKFLFIRLNEIIYRHITKPLLFKINPEVVHERMTIMGFILGKIPVAKGITKWLLLYKNPKLTQNIAGLTFQNPIGLSAGFDYEAKLTQILPSVGFGFETTGTITNLPYEGNPRPMLGRLPKSKSLMVNKGFKNLGAEKTAKRLKKLQFEYPLGISIGRSNRKEVATQKKSIEDIVKAFKTFERAGVQHSFYELNISCPNLFGDITFYPPKNLEDLLTAVDKLKLTRPLFIKMPIEKSNKEVLQMLSVIAKHSPVGVIFGNLQKNRKDLSLHQDEVRKFPIGNFSGKPCFDRSNELISLTYKKYKKRFIIIGTGGVFSAHDAYEKIKRGASLVQLITGMIYQGPQLISDINMKLVALLEKDGYKNISEAVGTKGK